MKEFEDKLHGYTLIELIITIAVLSILVVLALPSFGTLLERNVITTDANNFAADLSYARSEAIKRNATVQINAKTGSWANGYIIKEFGAADSDAVRNITPSSRTVAPVEQTSPEIVSISFSGIGAAVVGGQAVFRLCKTSGNDGVEIEIASTGRITSDEISCP